MNPMLARLAGETDLQYHRRLVYGKLVDKTLADVDYAELSEYVYGQKFASDECRKRMYGSKLTLDAISAAPTARCSTEEIDNRIAEMKIERQKLIDQRTAFNKSIREVARQQELTEIIFNAVNSGNLPSLEPVVRVPIQIEDHGRDLLVSLNDMHFGAVVNNKWRKYDSDVCKSMLEEYAFKIKKIADETGAQNCYIWNAGDVISGNLHRSIQVSNRENVIQQVCGASEIIASFIVSLSTSFEKITYVSVAGNHSRIEANKKDSIVAERLDNMVGWYLSARLQNFHNVVVANNATVDDTMFMLNIRGKHYCGVHGDFDSGNASVQALKTMCESISGEPANLYAVLSGHLHHNKIDSIGGVKTIMAGSFLGADDYCVQRRIYSRPEQLVCVVDDTGVVCTYDIQFSDRA